MDDAPQQSLPKTFDPAAIEARWYAHWEENGSFRPDRPDAEPFTIVNPPPNVTGSLHIGHALDNTLQDILVRYERLRGKDALWVVGTDHAGIATQMVVERQMAQHQQKRTDFTREEFVAKVWEWKHESGGTITQQLRRLGCSMDWSREQFTMDPHFTAAVTKVFVDLHAKGLIYRDKRLVNWDPGLKTAISDLEVETRETKGHFWHFQYPLADGSGSINVATTRPETMLADMAVAVHPDDERYRDWVGKTVRLPITGREIPIVADEHADPELGSGAVKITPGHDFNDFEVGKRAGIAAGDMLNMLDGDANVVQTSDGLIPEAYLGLSREDARTKVVAQMKAEGFLVAHIDKDGAQHDAEPRTIQTPYGDRSGQVIEPWLTDQWYVDAETLAKPAIEAVKSGAVEIVPKSWEKTFYHWMENIQPWCISRQLWWGHRIPAWYGLQKRDGSFYGNVFDSMENHVFVAADDNDLSEQLAEYYGAGTEPVFVDSWDEFRKWNTKFATDIEFQNTNKSKIVLVHDPDVLDTWFSSALWPFATLGWPEQTDLVQRHYPNDVLISGFDILFFWDARMLMQGIELTGTPPWKTLYLHGLVRAADGQKMSKSKGNTVDPLGLIDQYGADALRFFMAAMESQGRDIKMDDARLAGYRNFATKLWNAARFCEFNGIGSSTDIAAPAATLAVNKWIIGEVAQTATRIETALAAYRFDDAANAIYHFTWDRFCDWYLELIKPVLSSPTPSAHPEPVEGSAESGDRGFDKLSLSAEQEETKAVAGWAFDQILVMLHPFMPFITEELWHAMAKGENGRDHYDLITAKWVAPDASVDGAASAEIDWLIALTREIRSAKTELGLAPGAKLTAHFPASLRARVETSRQALSRVARLETISFDPAPEGASIQLVVEGETIGIPLEGVIDLAAERDRLTKALAAATKDRDGLAGRLANASFVERAKPEAVDKARADHAEKSAEAERLQAALDRLG
ncbi:valine--tRNA ligase [Sphingorhabdus soli]|uniref:Valine--tRNA ligase n=1 Tax=Flavisphingopyxis soli TaxID=2601267 RepID=A0A5C6UTJ6_9SPHN|nr:valine--tRNA ligase [Sphingorhabdus soli]TXC74045.1 valine--tRNA ligase [Sphingorhabdus soli]